MSRRIIHKFDTEDLKAPVILQYDDSTGTLYANGKSLGGGFSNTALIIDPVTGVVSHDTCDGCALAAGNYIAKLVLTDGTSYSNLVTWTFTANGTDWYEIDYTSVPTIRPDALSGIGWVSFNGGPFQHMIGNAYVTGIYLDSAQTYDSVPIPSTFGTLPVFDWSGGNILIADQLTLNNPILSGNLNIGGDIVGGGFAEVDGFYKVKATNNLESPAWAGMNTINGGRVQIYGPPGTGITFLEAGLPSQPNVVLNAANVIAGQGTTWNPDFTLRSNVGSLIMGPLGFASSNGSGPQTITGTGLGSGNYDVSNAPRSTDTLGQIWVTAGSGSATSGHCVMTFNQVYPSSPIPIVTLVDFSVSWNVGATLKAIATTTQLTVYWDNNGIPLPNGGGGPGMGINYLCFASS